MGDFKCTGKIGFAPPEIIDSQDIQRRVPDPNRDRIVAQHPNPLLTEQTSQLISRTGIDIVVAHAGKDTVTRLQSCKGIDARGNLTRMT